MHFLAFQLGDDRYALEARNVIEILPLVNLKPLLHAPCGVAGIFNYWGRPVPVLDLCELALGRPAARRLSTRIVLVDCVMKDSRHSPLGLIVERATQMFRRERSDFVDTGVTIASASYLGAVAHDEQGMIQLLEFNRVVTPALQDALFRDPVEELR